MLQQLAASTLLPVIHGRFLTRLCSHSQGQSSGRMDGRSDDRLGWLRGWLFCSAIFQYRWAVQACAVANTNSHSNFHQHFHAYSNTHAHGNAYTTPTRTPTLTHTPTTTPSITPTPTSTPRRVFLPVAFRDFSPNTHTDGNAYCNANLYTHSYPYVYTNSHPYGYSCADFGCGAYNGDPLSGFRAEQPDEYVELRNDDIGAIQLQNWTLRNDGQRIFRLP